MVRKGNPEGIEDWDDLVTGDVDVITPNPFTSGGARWNIMAAYGQVIENGGTEEEGLEFVQQLLENTPIQDASARDALSTFVGGEGDVLLSYENEAIGAIRRRRGRRVHRPRRHDPDRDAGRDPDRRAERR